MAGLGDLLEDGVLALWSSRKGGQSTIGL